MDDLRLSRRHWRTRASQSVAMKNLPVISRRNVPAGYRTGQPGHAKENIMSEPSSDQPETAKRGLGCTDVVMRLRYWFLDTFGERWSEKAYIGHGDFTEINGWMFRGQFYPFDIDDAA